MKGVSEFDQPHAFRLNLGYETPAVGPRRGWLDRTLGQWEWNSVLLAKSGVPFGVQIAGDAPGLGNVDGQNDDRPIVLDPSILGRSIGHPDTSAGLLPASAFAYIPVGELRGNLGRNTFRQDGIWNVNSSLSKRWVFGGEESLRFRAEVLNLTNTPQFNQPGNNLGNDNFGQITNTVNDGRTFNFTLQFAF
jgi:hypothetical protein